MDQAPIPKLGIGKTGTVNIDGLNVRSNASASSTILAVLDTGTKVAVTAEIMNGNTKWYRIDQGYAAARYITVNGVS
jgi:uncharacterized protein YgiM (DUF1202 family)